MWKCCHLFVACHCHVWRSSPHFGRFQLYAFFIFLLFPVFLVPVYLYCTTHCFNLLLITSLSCPYSLQFDLQMPSMDEWHWGYGFPLTSWIALFCEWIMTFQIHFLPSNIRSLLLYVSCTDLWVTRPEMNC